MERAFDQRMADLIRDFTRELGVLVREFRAYDAEMQEEIDNLRGENARLTAKLQGVRDQVSDVSDDLPTVDQIAARGHQHESVNADIRQSAVNLKAMETEIVRATPVKHTRGLSMLLQGLRNQNQPYRHPLSAESPPEFHDTPKVSQA